jgi:SAM-dependent methyltransferase
MLEKIFRKLKALPGQKDYVKHQGVKLPVSRSNEKLSDNQSYLESGKEQINYLLKFKLINNNTKLLDFGCGQGRLLNSLVYYETKFLKFCGLDTSKEAIHWCKKHLQYSNNISFIHLPAANARYNPKEKELRTLPYGESEFDLIFLNSVFSHMLTSDIEFYLLEFYKVLKNQGNIYITAFIEDNVPDIEENPEGYLSKSIGPLHRVRYEKQFFYSLVNSANFTVTEYHNQLIERTKQSVIILKKQQPTKPQLY